MEMHSNMPGLFLFTLVLPFLSFTTFAQPVSVVERDTDNLGVHLTFTCRSTIPGRTLHLHASDVGKCIDVTPARTKTGDMLPKSPPLRVLKVTDMDGQFSTQGVDVEVWGDEGCEGEGKKVAFSKGEKGKCASIGDDVGKGGVRSVMIMLAEN